MLSLDDCGIARRCLPRRVLFCLAPRVDVFDVDHLYRLVSRPHIWLVVWPFGLRGGLGRLQSGEPLLAAEAAHLSGPLPMMMFPSVATAYLPVDGIVDDSHNHLQTVLRVIDDFFDGHRRHHRSRRRGPLLLLFLPRAAGGAQPRLLSLLLDEIVFVRV